MNKHNILLTVALLTLVFAAGLGACGKSSGWKKVSNDDPQILAASQKAKDTYTDFLKAFKARRQGCFYTVEVQYSEGNKSEVIGLEVMKASDTEITGVIIGHPSQVSLQNGAALTVPVSTLWDWRVDLDDGTSTGGYVADVRAKLSRAQAGDKSGG
ncbi:MAG: DUF2314 domain-containing protein [Phycisphaerales bacterium]|nr:DUF2314 domain-containing protein [Phycisphaerales bacterium]